MTLIQLFVCRVLNDSTVIGKIGFHLPTMQLQNEMTQTLVLGILP